MKAISILALGLGFAVAAACSSSDDKASGGHEDGGITPDGTGGKPTGGTGGATSNDDGGTPPGRVIRVEEIRTAVLPLARAACEWSYGCCTEDERAYRFGATEDAADCAERMLDAAMNDQSWTFASSGVIPEVLRQLVRLQRGLDYARVRIDEAAVAACAKQEKDRECAQPPEDGHCVARPIPDPTGDPCSKVLVGTQRESETCDVDTDCGPGLRCSSFQNRDGACVPELKEGDHCSYDCPSPLVCDFTTGTCVRGAGDDEKCAFADDEHRVIGTETVRCRPDLLCDKVTLTCTDESCAAGTYCTADVQCPQDLHCVNGTCDELLPAGAPCGDAKDCAGGICRYVPARQRQVCAALAAKGGECQQHEDCASGYCKFGNDSGACANRGALGDPCLGADACDSYRCEFDAVAGANVCAAPKPTGSACTGDGDCNPPKKILCVDSLCVQAPLATGATCSQNQQCRSGACSKEVCRALGTDGSPCAAEDPPCDDGFYCDDDSDEPTCAAKKKFGEPCTGYQQCAGGNCNVVHGEQRCSNTGPGEVICTGP